MVCFFFFCDLVWNMNPLVLNLFRS
jgi:hypothetical protein